MENIRNDFSRLKEICYLDHTGCALYSDSQMEAVFRELKGNLFGNPHSSNSVGEFSKTIVDQMRYKILHHFGTDEYEYSVIFTSGATQALKLMAEWFQWNHDGENKGNFVYSMDNHTSVLGLREIALEKGALVSSLEHDRAFTLLNNPNGRKEKPQPNSPRSLFAYSAQCNFSGVKYPEIWVKNVQAGALNFHSCQRWYCLLDAATFAATNPLNLSHIGADFVAVSFYKLFGFPTGIGALLVKNSSADALGKRYYGGGTILVALSDGTFHRKKEKIHESYEDGTLNYLSIAALRQGFDVIYRAGSMLDISQRVFQLAKYVHDKLTKLHHENGRPAFQIYRDTDYEDVSHQGNIVNFNVLRDDGKYVGYFQVMQIAELRGIQFRTGCFCNPGSCQRHMKLTNEQLLANYKAGHTCANNLDLVNGRPTGSIRVSFGYSSIREDADKLLDMLIECFLRGKPLEKWPRNWDRERKRLRDKFMEINTNFMKEIVEEMAPPPSEQLEKMSLKICNSVRFPRGKVCKLFVYPVKSCGYYEISRNWILTNLGLQYDREFMIVTENGVALTQKRCPIMCAIRPFIDTDENHLLLRYKNLPEIRVNLGRISSSTCQSKICSDRVSTVDCGDAVSEWLSKALNTPNLRLMRLTKRHSQQPLSLANRGQLLLITRNSVQRLAHVMGERSEAELSERFRANVVVEGDYEAFSERHWRNLRLGQASFNVDGECLRCQMICIHQGTGERDEEPLAALSEVNGGKIAFGVYLRMVGGEMINVGSIVEPSL